MKKVVEWKKVDLLVCNPINKEQLAAAKKQVEGILASHPDAKTTWLQSSASRTLEGGILAAQHVLTCAIEYNTLVVEPLSSGFVGVTGHQPQPGPRPTPPRTGSGVKPGTSKVKPRGSR